MSLACDLDAAHFQALLNGLVKGTFLGDADVTDDLLVEELFGGSEMKADDARALVDAARGALSEAAANAWNVAELEEHLAGSTDASEEHAAVFAKVWQARASAVHDAVVRRSQWGDSLSSVAWRIDVKTTSRAVAEMDEPTAIVELGLDGARGPQAVQFEMSPQEVRDVVDQLEAIEKHIANTA